MQAATSYICYLKNSNTRTMTHTQKPGEGRCRSGLRKEGASGTRNSRNSSRSGKKIVRMPTKTSYSNVKNLKAVLRSAAQLTIVQDWT